ncbi:MAG: cation-transporting P-type ATPase, partial [Thermodesulfovibrionales bacterium]|nr:cation-transporting P-type ATPase [Thermodesulfovibrionales bacterium]
MLQIVHSAVKGRIRYKHKGLYRCEPLKTLLEDKLLSLDFVKQISINTYTSSVLVIYNHENNTDLIEKTIRDAIDEYQKDIDLKFTAETKSIKANSQKSKGPLKSRRKLRLEVERAEAQVQNPWHLMDSQSVINHFSSSKSTGLSMNQVEENLKKYGPNVLPEAVPRSALSILLGQINSLPVMLLGLAAGVSAMTGGIADAVVILGVVAINATIGYITESQSEKTIYSLKSLVRPSSHVVRSSRIVEVPADEITPGDLLVLRPGSYISADARLIESNHLTVDESALTGESMPVLKTSDTLFLNGNVHNLPIAERTNMVYMGTLVTGGQGLAVVTTTGKYTEIGQIQILAGEAKPPETPMERQLNHLGNQLALICGGVCGLVFLMGLLRGYGLLEMLKSAISLAVAAIPEGLPTVATTTLAIGIRNMKRHNVLI